MFGTGLTLFRRKADLNFVPDSTFKEVVFSENNYLMVCLKGEEQDTVDYRVPQLSIYYLL